MPRRASNDTVSADIAARAEIRPILPLLCLAWTHGELSPDEIGSIRSELPAEFLSSRPGRRFIATWLRPDQPPSEEQIEALLQLLRDTRAEPASAAQAGEAVSRLESIVGISAAEAAGLVAGTDAEATAPSPASAVDVESLRELLDGRHGQLRQRIRGLLSEPGFELQHGLGTAAHRKLVLRWCQRIAAEGLGSLAFPPEHGGRGDRAMAAVMFEMLAFHDTSLLIKHGVQFGLFGGSINRLGVRHHHAAYLRKVGAMDLPGCYAMTELGHGSNVAGIETTATYDPEAQCFTVSTPHPGARKEFIGNAARDGRMATVFAQLWVAGDCHGVHAVLVPIRDEDGRPAPGVRIGDCGVKMGLNGVDNGWIEFRDVKVPRENLLSRYAQVNQQGRYSSSIPDPHKRFFTTLGALVMGRLSVALGALSAAKTGLAIAVLYGDRRRQFGPPGGPETKVLDYLTHQRRLLPHLATAYALDVTLKSVTDRFAAPDEPRQRENETLIAGLKAYSTWFALEALQQSRECCGGQGYLAANRIGPLRSDTEIFVTFEGDNTVLMQLVAKGLLTNYRRQFEDMRAFTVARYLAGIAETAITELNPVTTRLTRRDHLRDPRFQQAAFAQRETHLLTTAARRLRHRISNGMSTHDAFLTCQDHLVSLAKAHVERTIARHFADAAHQAAPSIRATLKTLSDLFALSRLEADRAWFLERGYFAPAKSKAIRGEVNALCAELRPLAPPLVRAFGIPPCLLPEPGQRPAPQPAA